MKSSSTPITTDLILSGFSAWCPLLWTHSAYCVMAVTVSYYVSVALYWLHPLLLFHHQWSKEVQSLINMYIDTRSYKLTQSCTVIPKIDDEWTPRLLLLHSRGLLDKIENLTFACFQTDCNCRVVCIPYNVAWSSVQAGTPACCST